MTDYDPAPLLLPGLHGTDALWRRFTARWAGPVKTLSYRPDPEATLEEYADQVEGIFLGTDQRPAGVDLIAESFSGPVALAVVARRRIHVRRVVLVASFAAVPHPWLVRAVARMPHALVSLAMGSRLGVVRFLANGVGHADLIDDVLAAVRGIPPAVVASRLRVLANLPDPGTRITCPVLAVQADNDRLIPESALAALHQACADLRVVRLAGPHLLLQASPAACVDAIRAFLA